MAIERIEPNKKEWVLYYGNHISRYSFARERIKHIKNNSILDIACGVGYGSKHLSELPNTYVIGVDKSKEALLIANEKFKSDNITFVEDDCLNPINISKYDKYDIIISFETLEHLKNPGKFLQTCYDKLNDDGTYIVSTPNACVTSPDGTVTWEYHEIEYKADEFVKLLSDTGFEVIELYGQELNEIGVLKNEMRAFINHIYSNWFIRLGHLIRGLLKPEVPNFILPEYLTDFAIKQYSIDEINNKKNQGPFVIIAICKKSNNK